MERTDLIYMLRGPSDELAMFLTVHQNTLPEIWALKTLSETAGGDMHKDNFAHTIQVVRQALERDADDETLLAALFHDIGKPLTRSFSKGKVMFHNHEIEGIKALKARFRELGWKIGNIPDIILNSSRMQAYDHSVATDSAVRRMNLEIGDLWEQSMILARSDVTSKHQRVHDRVQGSLSALERRMEEVAVADAEAAFRPVLNGHDLMEMGFEPGRELGKVLTWLRWQNLEGHHVTPEAAREAVTKQFLDSGTES